AGGASVADADPAAVALEKLIGQCVANLGQSGYGTLQELKVLEKVALPLRPRLVAWFFFEGNDLYDDEAYENALAYYRAHGTLATRSAWAPDFRHFAATSFTVSAYRLFRRAVDPAFPNEVASVGFFPADAAGGRP